MKSIKIFGLLFILSIQCIRAQVPTFTIDQLHSIVKFSLTYLEVMEFEGRGDNFYSEAYFDPLQLENSKVNFIIYTPGLNTGMENRDNDLHSQQYLDTGEYQAIIFTSSRLFTRDNQIYVAGNLTIKDVTKHITLPIKIVKEDNYRNSKMYVIDVDPFTIKRSDYNIGSLKRTSLDRIFLGDEIQIHVKALYKEIPLPEINADNQNQIMHENYKGLYKQSEKSTWEVHKLGDHLYLMLRRSGIMWQLKPLEEDLFMATIINKKVKFIRGETDKIEHLILEQKQADMSDGKVFQRVED